jgi:hypothetical protein
MNSLQYAETPRGKLLGFRLLKHRLLTVFGMAVFSTAALNAQIESEVSVGFGYQGFFFRGGDLYLDYVDESPSRDVINGLFELNSTRWVVPLRLGIDLNSHSDWTVGFGGTLMLGTANGIAGDVKLGKYLSNEYAMLRWRPWLKGSYGIASKYIGEMEQNDLYIQVNDVKFYSDFVSVSAGEQFYSIGFGTDLIFPISSDKVLGCFSIGYNVGTSMKPFLKFDGKDEQERQLSSREDAMSRNVTMEIIDPIVPTFTRVPFPLLSPTGICAAFGFIF